MSSQYTTNNNSMFKDHIMSGWGNTKDGDYVKWHFITNYSSPMYF